MHLHNYRLVCAIGTCFRDGAPCYRCRGRRTLPGLVLNCRGSLPEAAVYSYALSRHQPALFAGVDLFIAPSAFAAGRLEKLGVPGGQLRVVHHYVPEDALADRSRADEGEYALFVGRLAPEKGVRLAMEAAGRAGVPLKVAGDGPLADELRAGAPKEVELLGRVGDAELRSLLEGAAMAVVPSMGDETFGFFALEAMAAGLPVIASRAGALPEIVGEERCVPRGDAAALADRMSALWRAPAARAADGEEGIRTARERFGRERFTDALSAVYAEVKAHPGSG
jgi:glycosyltransferase involved in cell wall biosynthesis